MENHAGNRLGEAVMDSDMSRQSRDEEIQFVWITKPIRTRLDGLLDEMKWYVERTLNPPPFHRRVIIPVFR